MGAERTQEVSTFCPLCVSRYHVPVDFGMSDAVDWLNRLRRAFGSPNLCT